MTNPDTPTLASRTVWAGFAEGAAQRNTRNARPAAGALPGEVGDSNTQLYCQIDTRPAPHHPRVP
jgi:hypothetical protein